MYLRMSAIFAVILTFLGIYPTTQACTDFRITAKDGTVLITRSMEYAINMNANLRTSPRGRVFTMVAPDHKPGITWKAKYGYLFLDGMKQDIVVDGMNEVGLSIEALYLPGFAEYQSVPADHDSQALPYLNFGDWVLSNFKTVDEVTAALPNLYVFPQAVPGMGNMLFPLHFSIFDASGKGIVVEYVKGQLHVYDHIGVLTNSPTYDWHVTNLQNYLHLAPINPPPVIANGVTFAATGQGFGMIGMPGDISPPSRFVKIATLLHVALPAKNASDALNLAEHLINNVDIILGEAREPQSGKYINDITQWVVFKDLTHKQFYYRTYGNMALRNISMNKIDFSENAARLIMPIATPEYIDDVTNTLLKSIK